MKTGVCYYPEHWPRERWTVDAAHMRSLGLSVVRVGEFAWSRLESSDGQLHFQWLQDAIEVLHQHGLSVVLGTPTATPPRWMIERFPDMLAVDAAGRTRAFGSRRHYCFSHAGYRDECRRIVTALARHFGEHPAIIAWQTDNEYGCHDTSISYSTHALRAFQHWCAERYGTIDALNDAWGNVFWSMEYDHFEQIGLPVGTVTEANPAHQLAFWRFSSNQIRHFNQQQVDIIRAYSPGRDVVHNFMGNYFDFDHHEISQDLDVATWDNYPLGFLTRDSVHAADRSDYLRTGHPDGSAFHHDLYRGMCKGRWWVMEQQPGPVNWAPFNPSPLPGMVRLWGWEAFAHGAEVMSYFRWRQAPFAQEQTHTGLLLPNAEEDVAATEIATLNRELAGLPQQNREDVSSPVALVFDYQGLIMQYLQQAGGQAHSPLDFCHRVFSACRQWGLDIDVVSADAALDGYQLLLIPHFTLDDDRLIGKLSSIKQAGSRNIVLFPGSGSRTLDFSIPAQLAPGRFRELIDITVVRSETLPNELVCEARAADGKRCRCNHWREQVRSALQPAMRFSDGWGFHYTDGGVHYINAIPCQEDLLALIGQLVQQSGLVGRNLGPVLRTRRFGQLRVAFNYGEDAVDLDKRLGATFQLFTDTPLLVGERHLRQAQVAIWPISESMK